MQEEREKIAHDFAETGEVWLKANRDAPLSVAVRMQTQAALSLPHKRKAEEVYLVGGNAITLLKEVIEPHVEDAALKAYVELVLSIVRLPKCAERKRLLAIYHNRTRCILQKRKANKPINWRKAIAESSVAKRMVLRMLLREALGPASTEVFGRGDKRTSLGQKRNESRIPRNKDR